MSQDFIAISIEELKTTTNNVSQLQSITKIIVSPNDQYLITYSDSDNSFVGWDVKDKDEGQLKPDGTHFKEIDKITIKQICVSDEKKLAYIYSFQGRNCLNIVAMQDINKKINVYFNRGLYPNYCAFNLDNKFILYGNVYKKCNIEKLNSHVWIYNTKDVLSSRKFKNYLTEDELELGYTQPKNVKRYIWECEKLYEISKTFDLISISKDDKMYLFSDNSIYEWNIVTGKMVGSIFANEEQRLKKNDIREIKISSNDHFICLRYLNKVIIYSIELDVPIASLDVQRQLDGELLNKLMGHPGLFPILPSLSSLFGEVGWKECLDHLIKNKEVSSSAEDQTERLKVVQTTSDNYVFEILNGYVQKCKLVKTIDFLKYAKEVTPKKSDAKNLNEELPKNDHDKKTDEPLEDAVTRIIEEFIKIKNENSLKNDNDKKTDDEELENEKYGRLNVHLFDPKMNKMDKMDTKSFHTDLKNFLDYRVFEIGYIEDKDDDDEIENKDQINNKDVQIDNDNIGYRDGNIEKVNKVGNDSKNKNKKNIGKECIYIELPKDVLKNESMDDGYIYIKVPTNVPADDKLRSKHEEAELHEDKQQKYKAKESIYIKVPKGALINTTDTSSELIQDLVRIKIGQTYRKNDYNNEWELIETVIEKLDEWNKLELDQFHKNENRKSKNLDNKEKTPFEKIEVNLEKSESERIEKLNFSNHWNLICTKIEEFNRGSILGIKSFDINNIVVLTKLGLFIYYFNDKNKSLSLNYYYFMDYIHIEKYFKEVTKGDLPLPNYDSFAFKGWVLRLLYNKESLLNYGVELLTFAIKEHDLDLIDKIYDKCIEYFKDDGNNRMFLSIITSTMPLFNDYYPDYINKYSLDTNMMIDSSYRNKDGKQECLILIERRNKNLHLHAFSQSPLIEDLTPSIPWTKYNYKFQDPNSSIAFIILMIIQFIIVLFTLPLYFITFSIFYILESLHLINDIYRCDAFAIIYYYIFDRFTSKSEQVLTPTITFMVPYVKFVNYPGNYNWFKDLVKPQPSPFVTVTNCKEIYKTWSGEAIINFKWNTYGKYYYYAIWIGFITLLVCFTIATQPQQSNITEDIRKPLLIVSTILGFFYLSVEFREIIYDPIRWVRGPWNYFDVMVYVLPISTSIYLLKTNDRNDQIVQLISYSCLLLDLRLLLLFKIFKQFGVYFAIIINVAKKVYMFLLLFIIIMMMSFAHAFYILLSPKLDYTLDKHTINKDPNNPWNLASTYNQVFDNGTVNPNPFIIQPPDENTNMFANYGTAVFAVSLFFTGDTSALSNWTYQNNWALVILMTLFTFLTVIYVLNVFIGLFSEAMQFNAESSMLVMKAEILAEIELFYLLPHQRRWRGWFPEVLYYYASLDKTRNKVYEIIEEKAWNDDEFSDRKQALLKALNIKKDEDALTIIKNY